MITYIFTKKAEAAMSRTLNDNAKLTEAVMAACESELYHRKHDERLAYGSMSLGQAYELMRLLTHDAACETIIGRKPVSRLAIVKVLRLVFELGYNYGQRSNTK